MAKGPSPANSDTNRQATGTNLHPFYADNLTDRHTQQITSGTTSAEEFPWASLTRGGSGAHLMPATVTQQSAQGTALSAGYNSAHVPFNGWLTITFSNYDTSLVYCPALFENHPDTSVCGGKKNTMMYSESIFPGDYDYQKVAGSRPIVFDKSA